MRPQTEQADGSGAQHEDAKAEKPPRLPEPGRDGNRRGRFGGTPCAVRIPGHHAKAVRSRTEVRVNGLACRGGIVPGSIVSVEAIAKQYARGIGQAQTNVTEDHA